MTKKAPAGVLGRIASAFRSGPAVPRTVWRPTENGYPRLLQVDPNDLAGRSGLYLLWHLGVRPQWLRVGFASDLGTAIRLLAETPAIASFEAHDGPFVSWSFCSAEDAPGFVNFLVAYLQPVTQAEVLACDAVLDSAAAPKPCPLPAGATPISAV